MAKWVCYRRGNGNMVLIYSNYMTGMNERLGETRPDVPEDMIVDWVVQTGNPSPGDVLTFTGGRVAQFLDFGLQA